MSDKELDKLFQSRFEDFEVEPSASLWASIEEQLDRKSGKRKQSFPVFWMAAASVVVLLGAGLWLANPEEKVYLQGKGQVAALKPQNKVVAEEPSAELFVPVTPETVKAVQIAQKRRTAVPVAKKPDVLRPNAAEQQNEGVKVSPTESLTEAVLATASNSNNDVNKSASVKSGDVHEHTERGVVHSTVLAMLPEENTEAAQPLEQRRRIKSVGDIVNFVVAKVDQREDKLIEMREDDEGTRISGINLGLFKLKSKKK